jgi:hypothetical protein
LKSLFSGTLSKVYINNHEDSGTRPGVACFVLVKRIG